MYLVEKSELPEICKDCIHKDYDSGFVGAGMMGNRPGYSCKKGRIMPTKSNRCNLKVSKDSNQR